MEQESVNVLTLSLAETRNLKEGINLTAPSENGSFVVYKGDDGYKACRNKCKHQGGTFVKDMEDIDSSVLRCTKHGWKLDCSNMRYVNPPDSFKQEELVPEIGEDGSLSLIELKPPQPWQHDARDPQPLEPSEVEITYFTHACLEMKFGDFRMFTDPWLTGPSFARGWWLVHEPPPDWLERLAKADLIYISHLHSDHLSYPTLELLQKKNQNIPIYVGKTSTPVFCKMEHHNVQMNNIKVLPFGVWKEINEDLRIMILMDGVHPELDTCVIIDYKGHLILDTVDCTNPNGGLLPENVDILFSDFAGGASGFPMTFSGGKYTEEWKANFIKRERAKLMHHKAQVVRQVNPMVYCPFAGYFVEAHPSDWYIKETNIKNNAVKLNELIKKYSPSIQTWTPLPGASLDLGKIIRNPQDRTAIKAPPKDSKILKDSWDFEKYVSCINGHVTNEIFAFPEWIAFYYKWCGFKNYNLVLRMIETDDNFDAIEYGYDFLVDFSGEVPTFPDVRPEREHNYLEIKNRIGVHRQTVASGLFWDDLYIGFNNRISRTPDTFHYQFWNHMQIMLPLDPPDWDFFLKDQKSKKTPEKRLWKPNDLSEIEGKRHQPAMAYGTSSFYSMAFIAGPVVLGIAAFALLRFTSDLNG